MERLVNTLVEVLKPYAFLRPGAFACRQEVTMDPGGEWESDVESLHERLDESRTIDIMVAYPPLSPVVRRIRGGSDEPEKQLELLSLLAVHGMTGDVPGRESDN
jgi:hypothetical protein